MDQDILGERRLFYIKTESIELEPRVAVPLQLWEHGAIGLPVLSGLPNQVS